MEVLRRWMRPSARRGPWSTIRFALLGIAVAFGSRSQASGEAPAREYEIKAVFLFNFAQFVEWPPEAFHGAHDPLVIGILGDDPFGAYMDEAVRGETVNGRPFVIRRFKHRDEITECHILFISRSEQGHLDQVIGALKGRSILTVGDMDEFSRRGGMIHFITENKKVRLRINIDAARLAGLRISSKLLRPAEIVSRLGN
jgi:hypothetical protein